MNDRKLEVLDICSPKRSKTKISEISLNNYLELTDNIIGEAMDLIILRWITTLLG